eukprot:gnl/TRDRNA2_/TRDRNA2_29297_c0_seq1.p1 gnl/TRDRNA2_/TRDRNA2_29297_c0~~gnl/TRDRNA2_/TRDRNA2_29297_c0_seq1.p1  ORF type:complete len:547 (+),score=58.59 gnl/TRDRNA2_/TRDRNA2_29297_c0_seq1:75-1715(+)
MEDGEALHGRVEAAKWCVTRSDLKLLRRQVCEAIREGRIAPTDMDPFDPKDSVIGPSVYTVVDQYIKPVTAEAGKMSWALMQHREGLLCDLFITHGWREGIFEFIDKVVNSWPLGQKHAYVCFLSNPQNLDISGMIGKPSESPFAKALDAAPMMMVVPNHAGSIYSRIWCVYEAYLAYTTNKIIFTATSPVWKQIFGALMPMPMLAVFGWLLHLLLGSHLDAIGAVTCIMCGMFSPFLRYKCRIVKLMVGWCGSLAFGTKMDQGPQSPYCLMMLFCCLSQADCVRAHELNCQKCQLHNGYDTIRKAESSKQQDKDCIWAEIGNQDERVEHSVEALLQAGMSTDNLREADVHGVNIDGAGMLSWAPMCVGWCMWFLYTTNICSPSSFREAIWPPGPISGMPTLEERSSFVQVLLIVLGYGPIIIWSFAFALKTVDAKKFASLTVLKFQVFFPMVDLIMGLMGLTPFIPNAFAFAFCFVSVMTLIVSTANVGHVSRASYGGSRLAGCILSCDCRRRANIQDKQDELAPKTIGVVPKSPSSTAVSTAWA